MSFDAATDKIAVTVPWFTFKKAAMGGPLEVLTDLIHNEPYLVTLAIDSEGVSQKSIGFNFVEYPNTRPGDTVRMLGDGHLVYGPKNPGEFVAVSILMMESDRDTRKLGDSIEKIVESMAVELGVGAILAADPGSAIVVRILRELTDLVGSMLKRDDDDPLFRTSGVFLRDASVPYSVDRQVERENEFVELAVKVIPLNAPNGEGPTLKTIRV